MKTHRDDLYLEIPNYRGYPNTTELVMDLKIAVEKLEIEKQSMLNLTESWELPNLEDHLDIEVAFIRQLKIFLIELENEIDRLDKQDSAAMEDLYTDPPF